MRRCIFAFAVIICINSNAQQVTKADYDRAVSFMWSNLINKKIFNHNTTALWFADSSGVAWVSQNAHEKVYHKLLWNREPERLFDQQRLAKLITDSLDVPAKATDLPITRLNMLSAKKAEISVMGKTYLLDLNTYKLALKNTESQNELEVKSPDGKWIAYVDDHNLFIRSATTGEKKQLSYGGQKGYEYASPYGWGDIIEGENGERQKRFLVRWSPDSRWIQTYISDFRSGNKMYLLDWSVDTLYRPKLLSYYRASPGDTGMVYVTPVFYNIESGKEIRRDAARNTHTFPPKYIWSKQPGVIYEDIKKRGFQEEVVNIIDLANNTEKRLYTETSKTNIDNFDIEVVEEWGKAIITSEKDGWKQLYLLDLKDASLKPLTNGSYYVNSIFIDKAKKTIFFLASGKEAERNPYYQHMYRIGLDGKPAVMLTPENATHDATVALNGRYILDNISAPDQPTVSVLRSAVDGKILRTLNKAVVEDLLTMGYKYPEVFVTTGRDGSTPIYSVIHKPSNFDPTKKYPVIDQSYTGPHTNMFPRNFTTSLIRSNQALAELGFIVVTIDGMGTAGRSKAFQSVSYKNMGKNLLDHVIAIKAMGRKYSWIDTTRVGIFGHSAGGYDAGHAVLEYPDFFKVAVASSADHDFRMEKDWWPEMYMGWPVDSTYHLASNITMAPNLKGKLLITHGGIDENVNPSATFKMAEALIKADKEFDMLILPSQRHGYTGTYNEYFTKKKWNYFVAHLLEQKPIWDFKWK